MVKNNSKILIRGVNWIGDSIMTLPAIKVLRQSYPDSIISLLVKPSVSPIFEKNPNIDEIILLEDRFKGFLGRLKLSNILREKNFSKAVLFQNAFDAALITFIAGIPERIGYNRDGRGLLLTKPIPFNNDDRRLHHIDYYLNLLRLAGITINNVGFKEILKPFNGKKLNEFYPYVYLSIDERLSKRRELSILKRPILGINPGAAYGSSKRWFPERFADVSNWFLQETKGSIVIFGSSSEIKTAEEILIKIRPDLRTENNVLNLTGKTTLRELIALISECNIFVTNDSGPMHIAFSVGTPMVSIFGSTEPELTGYINNNSLVLRSEVSCSPCFERTCKKNDMRCMYSISSDDVYIAIKKIFSHKKAVFFDRDGTLCRDSDYLSRWEDLEIFPEIDSLRMLKDKGFLLIGVSNQSGISRGFTQESFVEEVNNYFIERYGFDDFYYCPHHPDDNCFCRKPEPGMLVMARADHLIDLKKSYVVGDKDADMLLAKAVGAIGILVKTGKQQESPHADFIVKNLRDAVKLIISHG